MMISSIALLAAASVVALADGATPTVIVERLLEASAKEDWPTALAMLTADALLGIGDVGGPLNKETVAILAIPEKYGCRITSTREEPAPHRYNPELRFVEVTRKCPYGPQSGKSGEHETVTTYFVRGQKIAGFYLHAGTAPPSRRTD